MRCATISCGRRRRQAIRFARCCGPLVQTSRKARLQNLLRAEATTFAMKDAVPDLPKNFEFRQPRRKKAVGPVPENAGSLRRRGHGGGCSNRAKAATQPGQLTSRPKWKGGQRAARTTMTCLLPVSRKDFGSKTSGVGHRSEDCPDTGELRTAR